MYIITWQYEDPDQIVPLNYIYNIGSQVSVRVVSPANNYVQSTPELSSPLSRMKVLVLVLVLVGSWNRRQQTRSLSIRPSKQ